MAQGFCWDGNFPVRYTFETRFVRVPLGFTASFGSLTCGDALPDALPDDPQGAVAGTVFNAAGSDVRAPGVSVTLLDANGSELEVQATRSDGTYSFTVDLAANIYLPRTYGVRVVATLANGQVVTQEQSATVAYPSPAQPGLGFAKEINFYLTP